MVLLLVLAAIAVATVSLSSQERTNAAAKVKVDFLEACANAAQAKIWAEMAQYGMGYLGSAVNVTSATLPDGTRIVAPAHASDANPSTNLVKDVVFKHENSSGGGEVNERDCTNGACSLAGLGSTFELTAVCIDASGRRQELELSVKFAL
ncbi:MAG TPA: hypothetical protein VEA99_13130 [Gemmatimonadaceae bacterium]|nr:hypothetical protein [Gemmatimonadaceae bacterium]